jgi:simple sugar transport system ATP-binding protein
MRGIVKRFPGVLANDHVDFELRRGEVHALLGENGAGKTTLMNILYGLYKPDEGEIYIDGEKVEMRSPKDAIKRGIGMVHQHFKLVLTHTVTENIALGVDEFFLNVKKIGKRIEHLSRQYGLAVDPAAKIWQLSASERQRVEILKMLFMGARILILDEPTSILTPLETEELFSTLRRMVEEGRSVVFITHKLDEAVKVSDRVTILRNGKVVAVTETPSINKEKLAMMMIGRKIPTKFPKLKAVGKRVVLGVDNLNVLNDKGLPALRGVSLQVREGEILAVVGVAGNGQRELAEALAGLRRVVTGRVRVLEFDVTNKPPKEILEQGVAYIPEDRLGMAVSPSLSVRDNLTLRKYRYAPFSSGVFLNHRAMEEYTNKLIKEYNIMTPNTSTVTRLLSGGNIQRLVLARELSGRPKVIIAVNPTYGLDVAATEYVRNQLLKEREKGAAILLISEDLDEALTLSDRVAVMFRGEIVGVLDPKRARIEEISLMMVGALRKDVSSKD